MNVILLKRDYTAELQGTNLKLVAERYSFEALGGPARATLRAQGAELELWGLIERLRCPVQIFSEAGDLVWWGYVAEVQLSLGQWSVGVTIDSMYNAVYVAYEDQEHGGLPALTGAVEDSQSIAEYGRREIILTANSTDATHAEVMRDAALARMKWPTPVIRPNPSGGEIGGTVYCRGWADTLNWTYYACSLGLAEFAPGGSASQSIGDAAARAQLAQGFQVAVGWTAHAVGLKLCRVGAPADNVTFALHADTAGAPGAALESGTVAGTAIGTTSDWVTVDMASGGALAAATPYWIVVSRSGAADPDNYYVLEVDEDLGYTSGSFLIYNGSAWVARSPDADLAFRVTGYEDTAYQVERIADDCEFISAIDREDAAGEFFAGTETNQYRDGYGRALFEMLALLNIGTDNDRRMLFSIDANRRLRIYEEPASTTAPYLLQRDGSIRDEGDRPIRNELCPAAMWTRLKEIIPPSVDTTKLADPSLMFVESAEYEPATGRLILTPRGADDPFNIGTVQDG